MVRRYRGTPAQRQFPATEAAESRAPEPESVHLAGRLELVEKLLGAAKTDALRKQLSCVKLFIAGDLPVQDGRGGAGSAKGVFDGIDIDWEYPGGGGQPYNTADAVNDKHNFTLLMQEFRAQLDAQGATDGKRYPLTAAIGAGTEKIAQTEPALYSQYMDWVNLMTYDFHGGWETTTNFHAPLYHDPADPSTGVLASTTPTTPSRRWWRPVCRRTRSCWAYRSTGVAGKA
jgi:hypothetical protein